jgi:hypothetical protein
MAYSRADRIDIGTLGSDVQKSPKDAEWVVIPRDRGIKCDKQGDIYIFSPPDGAPGFPVQIREGDVMEEESIISIRRGAKPLNQPTIAPEMRTINGCVYDPDECDSEGESGCTYCTGALLFCCGGGLTGACIGVWGCP